MGRTCSICRHPDRATVDGALVERSDSFRTIANRYGVSMAALKRHRADHLPERLAQAHAARETVTAETLLDRLRAINRETSDVLRAAKQSRDHDLRLRAITRAERQLELEARLLGQLQDGPTINVMVSAQWAEIQETIVTTLAPFPEARIAVAAALSGVDKGLGS